MFQRGPVAVGLILALGAAMAGAAVWYQAQQNHVCLDVWGGGGLNLVRHAPRVEVWKFPAPVTAADALPLDELPPLDISSARGLVHARHALVVDKNYDPPGRWTQSAGRWRYAVRFTADDRQAILVLDPDQQLVALLPGGKTQRLRAATMEVEVAFLEREFARVASRDNP